ncbi:MAG: YjfB family protein [Veillonellales bacterium]
MDIAALSVLNSQQQVQSQAGTMILKKAMDASTQSASEMLKMFGIGNNIDLQV